MEPEKFGTYILLDKIASGGMAEVYLAKASGAEGVSKFVAIKRILPQYSSNEDFIDMFKTEAKIAINISHTNIVPIYEFGENRRQFFLAMEYVHGKNLRQIINKLKKTDEKLPLEHVVFLINEVAKGLDYAHRFIDRTTGKPLNIIHRDMSPQNIMVSFEGEVKIVDFGIAKAESKIETTQAGTLKGKFGYMSPEQAEGLELDYRTDIFSLGIILWELLASDRLFVSNNEMNTLKKIKDCHIPELRKIDSKIQEDLELITNKSLARDRSLRYQSASEFHRDLNRFLNKHYPDYTSQDLSQFMKKSYLQEIMEMREKLIQFARVYLLDENTNSNAKDLSESTRTITNTATASEKNQKQAIMPVALTLQKEKSAANVDFRVATAGTQSSFKNRAVPYNTQSGVFSGNISNSSILTGTIQSKTSHTSIYMSFALLVMATYLYLDHDALLTVKTFLGLAPTPVETKTIASVDPAPPRVDPRSYNVDIAFYVKSNPSGAKIYIDEKDTGLYTPGKVSVKVNQPFNLTLRRSGHLEYSKQMMATENGQQFVATLQPAQIGFISVYVPGGNVDIYINGSKIAEKPPLENYAVQATNRLTIKAVNPITKAVDERTISVKVDTSQQIQLFPKSRR